MLRPRCLLPLLPLLLGPATIRVAAQTAAAGTANDSVTPAGESTSPVSLYAESRVVSRYLWRGYDLSLGKPAVQPYAELSLPAGLTVVGFASAALDRQTELDEVQLGLTWSRSVAGPWEVGFGYQLYLMPGTQTEPGTDAQDPLRLSATGEFTASVTRTWGSGYAALTYSRGTGSSAGNSVNLWVQHSVALVGARLQSEPYLQFDYLDQYHPPRQLSQRLAGLEVGLPLYYRVAGFDLLLSGHLTWVPSDYIRSSNGAAPGGSTAAILPWGSVGVVWGR